MLFRQSRDHLHLHRDELIGRYMDFKGHPVGNAMGKKKNSGGGVGAFIFIAILGAIAATPVQVWGWVLGIVVLCVLIKLTLSAKKPQSAKTATYSAVAPPVPAPAPHKSRQSSFPKLEIPSPVPSAAAGSDTEAPHAVYPAPSQPQTTPSYRIPPPPKGLGQAARWMSPGEKVEIGPLAYSGGLIYVGNSLPTPNGENDPCLIDPAKNLGPNQNSAANYRIALGGYLPNFASIAANARRAYVNWLVEGRRNPAADISYVFLFFYGLERRAIVDVAADTTVRRDWPLIAEELRQLISIYGAQSSMFLAHATALLDWVSLDDKIERPYDVPVLGIGSGYEVPISLRYALGRTALDGVPVPPHLALAWTRMHPEIRLRTPATRCPEEFGKIFALKYRERYSAGLQLQKNRTKLKFVYRPASSGFRGYKEVARSFGECPDVSVLTAPVKKLQELANDVCKDLDAYSRFLGKADNKPGQLEGLLHLPVALWPASIREALEALLVRVGDGMLTLPLQELLQAFGAETVPTKDKVTGLARALESLNIAIEPDLLGGVKPPKAEEQIVLFHSPRDETVDRKSASYKTALLTLQIASTVAAADGDFSGVEMQFMRAQIDTWTHLAAGQRRRLRAHLQLLALSPIAITSLKKRLEPLEKPVKEAIAAFMAALAQADGTVSADEIKLLEKAYKALGLDVQQVYSDVHAPKMFTASAVPGTAAPDSNNFKLDPARIAALQRDTERVSALLSTIFVEEEAAMPPVIAAAADPIESEPEQSTPGVLGLDEQHSTLVRMLMSRPQWTRHELLDIATDMDLMLDGALEKINEASFDSYDAPFTEGDDPIDVNTEVLEKVIA